MNERPGIIINDALVKTCNNCVKCDPQTFFILIGSRDEISLATALNRMRYLRI